MMKTYPPDKSYQESNKTYNNKLNSFIYIFYKISLFDEIDSKKTG